MIEMNFVFFHGSFSTPQDAWFPWLKEELIQLGHTVYAPEFPVDRWDDVSTINPDLYIPKQSLEFWLKEFEPLSVELSKKDDLCFLGHSLGPLFILHVIEKYHIYLRHAFFISPFFEIYGKSAVVEKANAMFYKSDFDFIDLKKNIFQSTVIYSDDDPYVSKEKAIDFAQKLGSRLIELHGYGHMGIESGLREFPELLKIITGMTK